jgi:hypothetical protein
MVQSTEGVLGNGSAGFLGLGRSYNNDSFISGVLRDRGWRNVTFGLALNTYNVSIADTTTVQPAGSLTMRELNPNLFTGEIHWQPVSHVTDLQGNTSSSWDVEFDSYKIGLGSKGVTNPGGVATIDPSYRDLRLPSSEATAFCSSILAELTVY